MTIREFINILERFDRISPQSADVVVRAPQDPSARLACESEELYSVAGFRFCCDEETTTGRLEIHL